MKQIDPIEFDEYVQENYIRLSQDTCSRQLILNELEEPVTHLKVCPAINDNTNGKQLTTNSLLLNDCLEAYASNSATYRLISKPFKTSSESNLSSHFLYLLRF